eukprot:4842799-Pyramimonas_sp.AAC.1
MLRARCVLRKNASCALCTSQECFVRVVYFARCVLRKNAWCALYASQECFVRVVCFARMLRA